MNVLVTGAAGFLGYHLCERLLSTGHRVVGLDNLQTGRVANVKILQSRFKDFGFVEDDILNEAAYKRVEEKLCALSEGSSQVFEQIFHLACPASPPLYQKDQLNTLDICFLGSKHVLNYARVHDSRILLASTSEIYGDPEVHPQPESYRGSVNTMGPRSCYDEGKRVMETLGYIYQSRGLEVRTVRIFNTYGPRMNPTDGRVVTNFISQALKGESLTIYGDGTQTRSLCYCQDLIDGCLRLMDSDVADPVNLGAQEELTVLEIAEAVLEIIDPGLQLSFHPLPQDDPKMRRPDTTRAHQLLGWQPKTPLKVGLQAMIDDFKAELRET